VREGGTRESVRERARVGVAALGLAEGKAPEKDARGYRVEGRGYGVSGARVRGRGYRVKF
jgi:hypothetical protein